MVERVILVDLSDNQVGEADKIVAHKKALLHRAVSAFIFNSKQELLLQKRALKKYHSPDLWTNTVCTHPRPNEDNSSAVIRRLYEEMGIKINAVTKIFEFVYKEKLDHNLTEHEFDHVFIGFSDELPSPDPNEVSEYKYVNCDGIIDDVKTNPGNYTVWFSMIIEKVVNHVKQK